MRNFDAGGPNVTAKSDPGSSPAHALLVVGLERRHPGGAGVGPLDIKLQGGRRLALLGPSGCGKTTLLRVLAGLEPADRGSIVVEGRNIDDAPPGHRAIGLVEQDLPLYDHLNVLENVDMAISGLRLDRAERRSRTAEALEIAGAADLGARKAGVLSGGERARTCLARLLARRPSVALLDEPFNGLDRHLREQVRHDTLRSLASAGVATILVTHDDRDLDPADEVLELDSNGRAIG